MAQFRSIALKREAASRASQGEDLTIPMAFASEEPYERWWGIEILDCQAGSVRLGRLNDGAALLYNHNWNDLRGVHVPGSVKCVDGVLRGEVRITAATQNGRDAIALVESDVLTKASVGYEIHKVIEQTTVKGEPRTRELDGRAFEDLLTRAHVEFRGDLAQFHRELDRKFGSFERAPDEPAVYRVVDWEPFENSLVTIPADPTVGVGRMADVVPFSPPPKGTSERSSTMTAQVEAGAPAGDSAAQQQQSLIQTVEEPTGIKLEKARQGGLLDLKQKFGIDDGTFRKWVNSDTTVNQAGEEIVLIMKDRSTKESKSFLDLSPRDRSKYSLTRAINAVVNKNWNDANFELEASREIQKRLGKITNEHTFYVPLDIQHRDLIVGTSTIGGYLVGTGNVGFIELLRNRSVLMNMGATRLGGLVGSVTVPRQTAPGTGYWLATEATQITESTPVLGQLPLSPKNVGAYTEVSRQLLLQSSPQVDGMVMADLAAVVGLAVDTAGISGPGTGGQPTGITATSGIGSVTITTGTVTYANVLAYQTAAAGANALTGQSGYVTTPAIAAILKQKQRFSSTDTPVWQGNILEGNIEGLRAMSSNQMASGQLLMGDFSRVVIAEWGTLEIEANPYANFQAGIVGIRAFYSVDIGVRYAGAFALGTGITA